MKVGFIGSYDKIDFMLYVAKALSLFGHSVLIVDTTVLQKSRYVVPALAPAQQYITTFEGIDVAAGFQTTQQLQEYIVKTEGKNVEYDYTLVDVDSARGYVGFGIEQAEKQYFMTTMDNFCLRRGLMAFSHVQNVAHVTRLLFSKEMLTDEITYIEHLSKQLKVKWNNEFLYFPFENGDQSVIYSNQKSSRIRIKGLSTQYLDGLKYVVEDISGRKNSEVNKLIKTLEKN